MPSAQLPAPVRGWNTLDPVASMPIDCAVTLDNMLSRAGGVAVRPGYRRWATGLPGAPTGLFAYRSGNVARLFTSSGVGIYDVTTPGAVAAPVQGGVAPGFDGVMMNATGGDFLLAFNGTDTPRVYDGAGWTTWTATGIPTGVSWATNHKGRLWVGDGRSMKAWYGGPLAFTGAFTEFPIRGVARRGGGIVGMAAWTLDGGNGPDDVAAFFTSEGEVLVYAGTDPSNVATWALRGRFDMPRPVSRRFLRQFGGDVLAMTEGGVFALSDLLAGVDAAALAKKALTRQVESAYRDMVQSRGTSPGWDLAALPALGLWMVNAPWGVADAQQIAFDGATGAPSRLLGLHASCWIETGGQAFFGRADEGSVCLFGQDASDAGAAIASEAVQAFSAFGTPGANKRFTLASPALGDAALAAVRVEMALDWKVPTPEAIARGPGAPPLVPDVPSGVALWDQGLWDVGLWGGVAEVSRGQRAVRGIGQAGAVRLRLLSAGGSPFWVGTGVIYERGGPMR